METRIDDPYSTRLPLGTGYFWVGWRKSSLSPMALTELFDAAVRQTVAGVLRKLDEAEETQEEEDS